MVGISLAATHIEDKFELDNLGNSFRENEWILLDFSRRGNWGTSRSSAGIFRRYICTLSIICVCVFLTVILNKCFLQKSSLGIENSSRRLANNSDLTCPPVQRPSADILASIYGEHLDTLLGQRASEDACLLPRAVLKELALLAFIRLRGFPATAIDERSFTPDPSDQNLLLRAVQYVNGTLAQYRNELEEFIEESNVMDDIKEKVRELINIHPMSVNDESFKFSAEFFRNRAILACMRNQKHIRSYHENRMAQMTQTDAPPTPAPTAEIIEYGISNCLRFESTRIKAVYEGTVIFLLVPQSNSVKSIIRNMMEVILGKNTAFQSMVGNARRQVLERGVEATTQILGNIIMSGEGMRYSLDREHYYRGNIDNYISEMDRIFEAATEAASSLGFPEPVVEPPVPHLQESRGPPSSSTRQHLVSEQQISYPETSTIRLMDSSIKLDVTCVDELRKKCHSLILLAEHHIRAHMLEQKISISQQSRETMISAIKVVLECKGQDAALTEVINEVLPYAVDSMHAYVMNTIAVSAEIRRVAISFSENVYQCGMTEGLDIKALTEILNELTIIDDDLTKAVTEECERNAASFLNTVQKDLVADLPNIVPLQKQSEFLQLTRLEEILQLVDDMALKAKSRGIYFAAMSFRNLWNTAENLALLVSRFKKSGTVDLLQHMNRKVRTDFLNEASVVVNDILEPDARESDQSVRASLIAHVNSPQVSTRIVKRTLVNAVKSYSAFVSPNRVKRHALPEIFKFLEEDWSNVRTGASLNQTRKQRHQAGSDRIYLLVTRRITEDIVEAGLLQQGMRQELRAEMLQFLRTQRDADAAPGPPPEGAAAPQGQIVPGAVVQQLGVVTTFKPFHLSFEMTEKFHRASRATVQKAHSIVKQLATRAVLHQYGEDLRDRLSAAVGKCSGANVSVRQLWHGEAVNIGLWLISSLAMENSSITSDINFSHLNLVQRLINLSPTTLRVGRSEESYRVTRKDTLNAVSEAVNILRFDDEIICSLVSIGDSIDKASARAGNIAGTEISALSALAKVFFDSLERPEERVGASVLLQAVLLGEDIHSCLQQLSDASVLGRIKAGASAMHKYQLGEQEKLISEAVSRVTQNQAECGQIVPILMAEFQQNLNIILNAVAEELWERARIINVQNPLFQLFIQWVKEERGYRPCGNGVFEFVNITPNEQSVKDRLVEKFILYFISTVLDSPAARCAIRARVSEKLESRAIAILGQEGPIAGPIGAEQPPDSPNRTQVERTDLEYGMLNLQAQQETSLNAPRGNQVLPSTTSVSDGARNNTGNNSSTSGSNATANSATAHPGSIGHDIGMDSQVSRKRPSQDGENDEQGDNKNRKKEEDS